MTLTPPELPGPASPMPPTDLGEYTELWALAETMLGMAEGLGADVEDLFRASASFAPLIGDDVAAAELTATSMDVYERARDLVTKGALLGHAIHEAITEIVERNWRFRQDIRSI